MRSEIEIFSFQLSTCDWSGSWFEFWKVSAEDIRRKENLNWTYHKNFHDFIQVIFLGFFSHRHRPDDSIVYSRVVMCHLSSCALLMKNSWNEWKGEKKKLSFPVERISSSREIELWHENLIFNIKYFYISLSFPSSSLFRSRTVSMRLWIGEKNGRKYSPRRRNCTHKSFTWFENTWRRRWGEQRAARRERVCVERAHDVLCKSQKIDCTQKECERQRVYIK